MLHTVCCTLHVVRCMLDVVRCVLCVACCTVNVACCMLQAACCMLHAACCMLHMLHVVCCMFTLHVARRVDCRHCCLQDFLPVKDFLSSKAGSAIPPLARSTPFHYPRPPGRLPSLLHAHKHTYEGAPVGSHSAHNWRLFSRSQKPTRKRDTRIGFISRSVSPSRCHHQCISRHAMRGHGMHSPTEPHRPD
jgi:hypothetical protein